jgi:hypothetical protein
MRLARLLQKKLKIKKPTKESKKEEEVPNPAFVLWKAQEQQVLSYLLTSVSRDVLVQVTVLPSVVAIWKHIESAFTSQSRARVINTQMALATTQKGLSTVAEYISKMKTPTDDMASAEKKPDDEDFSSYVLASLDADYNFVVSSITARVEPISFGELYSQLVAHENRLDLQNGGQSLSSVNSASRGRGGFFRDRGGCATSPRGGGINGGRGCGDFFSKPKNKFPPCQLCGKTNHPIFKCFKRFDLNYMGEEKSVKSTASYGVDTNWYANSIATEHVTGDLDKLVVKDTYHGGDQIYIASGLGMRIKHIGHSTIRTPYRNLKLNHILHVPRSSRNLASIH